MRLQKHQRLMLDAIKKKWPQLSAKIVPARKHPKIIARYGTVQIQVSMSSTPACPEQSVTHSLQLIRRQLSVAGIVLRHTQTSSGSADSKTGSSKTTFPTVAP